MTMRSSPDCPLPTADSPDSRYRTAQAFEEMLFVEPDGAARDDYARVTPMHYLAVVAVLWLSIAAAAWLLLDMIDRWGPRWFP